MNNKEPNKFDLEERLIRFGITIIKLVEKLPDSKAGHALGGQIVRSGTSPALNYGEAQGAESRKDFIHKLRIILKELRETKICLKLINGSELIKDEKLIDSIVSENDELIAIFVTSIQTSQKKLTQRNN
jgi:four helix bundle protein